MNVNDMRRKKPSSVMGDDAVHLPLEFSIEL
jgi:DNA-binding CsgD family transcriptional regulator